MLGHIRRSIGLEQGTAESSTALGVFAPGVGPTGVSTALIQRLIGGLIEGAAGATWTQSLFLDKGGQATHEELDYELEAFICTARN